MSMIKEIVTYPMAYPLRIISEMIGSSPYHIFLRPSTSISCGVHLESLAKASSCPAVVYISHGVDSPAPNPLQHPGLHTDDPLISYTSSH